MTEQTEKHSANHWLRVDRGIQEMLGLVRGVVCDGEVSEEEAVALREWIAHNDALHSIWPVHVLYKRLEVIFNDGKIDAQERMDLFDLLKKIEGGGLGRSTQLPVSDPFPELAFEGQVYVFTGKFVYGIRKKCEEAVISKGAYCTKSVTRATNFVVIGEVGSADWKFSSWGRKIQKAIKLRDEGLPIHIIPEEYWTACLR